MWRRRLSYSSLDTATRCRYKFYLKHILKLVPFLPVNYPLITGIAFHALVEEMYKTLNFDRKWLLRNWARHFNYELERVNSNFASTKGSDKHLKYGFGLVSKFHKFASINGYLVKPFQAEWKFKIPRGKYDIVGKVDLLIQKDKFEVLDFKTSWKVCSEDDLKKNKQLSIYDWAVKTKLGIINTQVVLFYAKKDAILKTTRTEEDHASVLTELDKLSEQLDVGDFAPNTDHCGKCEFAKCCKYYKKPTAQKS